MQKGHPNKVIGLKLLHTEIKVQKSFGFEIGIKFCVFDALCIFVNKCFWSYYRFSHLLKSNADETAHKYEKNIFVKRP
jgi:hypothetical protein